MCYHYIKEENEMKILIDSADIKAIEKLYECFPVCGVTTNPSLLSKENKDPYEVLKRIRAFIGEDELHVESLCKRAEDIVDEALAITRILGDDTYVKIPVTAEGVKAIKRLRELGIKTTATAIFTLGQAYISALAGASYVAPYVNRIEMQGEDGTQTALNIQEALRASELECKVLAASFKRIDQVEMLIIKNIDAITLSPAMLSSLLDNDGTKAAIKDFDKAFKTLKRENMSITLDRH